MKSGKTDEPDYSYPVHRSIMRRQLVFGVPLAPLVGIIVFTFIIIMDFKFYAFILISAAIIYIMREITKRDEYLLEIILFSLFDPDHLN